MKAPDTIIIEGRGYSWRALLARRRAQLEAWKAVQPQQPALFALKDDRRPEAECTTSPRDREPSFLALIQDSERCPTIRRVGLSKEDGSR